jgi:thioredoxin:protein disulfide reductase
LFSLLFVLLALSLFGFYELRLPHFLHHQIVHLSNRQRSGSFIGAFIMGALSVLIVSPCVTAPLVGVLSFIAQSGDVILGSMALFALGIGMGIPLLIIGTTEGKLLPKSGAWMEVVKSIFGVSLIAVAIYLLQRILPGSISLLLWASLLIILAVYLGVGAQHPTVSSGWVKFGKGLGLLSFCYGVILLVGAALGNNDPLVPLHMMNANNTINTSVNSNVLFQRVKNFADVQDAINHARQLNKPVILDFYADWCVSCHEMDRTTFADSQVTAALNNVELIRADVTSDDQSDRALENYYGVIAPPTILFFDHDGNEIKSFRIVGYMSPPDFLRHLQIMRSQTVKF